MTYITPVYNLHSIDEIKIVRLVRRFILEWPENKLERCSGRLIEVVVSSLNKFIGLLRLNDPFVVKLSSIRNHDVTLFELQLLYAISKMRAGDIRTVDELLKWWLPKDKVKIGRILLSTVAKAVAELDEKGLTSSWYCDRILSQAFKKVSLRNFKTSIFSTANNKASGDPLKVYRSRRSTH
tara:strand:- start:2984 stop:3526 length:543 start_codon:yes stop_codon:yes gene_type:complete